MTMSQHQGKVKVKKPNNLITSIYGTTSSYDYQSTTLWIFIKQHVHEYITNHFEERKLLRVIKRLRKETQVDIDTNVEGVPTIADENSEKTVVIESLVKNILWRLDRPRRPDSPLNLLCNWIWAEGYLNDTLKSHVFDDVPKAFNNWRMELFIKLYSLSTGDQSGQK